VDRPRAAPCPDRTARAKTAAVAAALAAALAGCNHAVHVVEPVGPAPPPRPAAARLLVFGDFGADTVLQALVARAMVRAHRDRRFDLAFQLGDNLYECGPDPLRSGAAECRFAADGVHVADGVPPSEDPIFEVNERPLRALRGEGGAPIPIYLVLGNHDVGLGCPVPGMEPEETRRLRACLSVARRSPLWRMPARRYVVEAGPVRLVAVDTNVVVEDYAGFTLDDELAFLDRALEGCGPGGRICFVMGHHPPAAAHPYGRGHGKARARPERLLAVMRGRAAAFFGGHVHSLGHVEVDGLDVFASGATAMGGYGRIRTRVPARAQERFATTAWGFAEVEADARGWAVRFVDFQGAPLHCCAADGAGPCRPVACAGAR
jgi:3',5'-cyclic AMP phosphodiesterase CpdA